MVGNAPSLSLVVGQLKNHRTKAVSADLKVAAAA